MKLFIADDNIPFRKRLTTILSSIEGVEIVGSAGEVPTAIELIEKTAPDAVILDIHMEGGSGFDVLSAVKPVQPDLKVIMLTVGQKNE
jgi:DNA-binding NarL/FixJ family response regulator